MKSVIKNLANYEVASVSKNAIRQRGATRKSRR